MDKSSQQLGVNPLTKISPLTAVAGIGTPAQALESRADHLAKQHAGLMAKMAVLETTQLPEKPVSTASVSDAAKLINQLLKQAEAKGITNQFIAQSVITQNPKSPEIVAQQLKAAISNSGLFYESHLKAFVEGRRGLSTIQQAPQNQLAHHAQTLLPQQLHLLDQQRFSWHGEVWPNQKMDWDVYLNNNQEHQEQYSQQTSELETDIASDLTLHLPNLGKVTAKISINNGHMQIGFVAAQKETVALLSENRANLAAAIEQHGQRLERLTMAEEA